LVQRNTNAKPYSYSITQNGLARLSGTGQTSQIPAINVIGAGQHVS